MRLLAIFILLLCTPLAGCEKEKEEAAKPAVALEEEEVSEKPAAGVKNAALNKTYTVKPKQDRYIETHETSGTDGKKPTSGESCFGYARKNTSLI